MAKSKKSDEYDLALGAVRAPVQKLDESIRGWDEMAKAIPGFNHGVRVVSLCMVLDPEFARKLAQAVMDGYAGRFDRCTISTGRSAHDGRPLETVFSFYELPENSRWYQPIRLMLDSDHCDHLRP